MKSMIKKFAMTALALPIAASFVVGSNANAQTGTHEETANITYRCVARVGILPVDTFDMPTTIRATLPDSVTPGEQFGITNSSATVHIPQRTVQTVYNFLGWDNITGNVSTFNVNSENETGTVNVANPPLTIPVTSVDPTTDLVFTVPGTGGVDAGPFTAGQSGQVTLAGGHIDATLRDADGNSFTRLNASCDPTGDTTLTDIPIN